MQLEPTSSRALVNNAQTASSAPTTRLSRAGIAAIEVIGMTEAAAIAHIVKSGLRARVVSRDGVAFRGTDDILPNRVNLTIVKNHVVSARVG